jgi:probable rRNA maturation factor
MIYYRNDVRGSGVDARALKATAKRLLEAAGEKGSSLSLTLVNDGAIRKLNRDHRGKDKPTDVLSFPLVEPGEASRSTERMLGDVVISVDTARRQAADYDATLQREVYRLLIHGILHVLGHDHERPPERVRMEGEERRLAGAIDMEWPYA